MAYNFTDLGDYSVEAFAVEDAVSQVASPVKTDTIPTFLGQKEVDQVILYIFLIKYSSYHKIEQFPHIG